MEKYWLTICLLHSKRTEDELALITDFHILLKKSIQGFGNLFRHRKPRKQNVCDWWCWRQVFSRPTRWAFHSSIRLLRRSFIKLLTRDYKIYYWLTYGTKNISGSIDVSNHRCAHVLTLLSRMVWFYDGWFSNIPNSLHRDRPNPIAIVQADFQPYW